MTVHTESWLDHQHPDYMSRSAKWKYASDHYTVAVLDQANIDRYLVRRAQGESEEAYQERKSLADYTPHFSALVDSLAGMIFNVESNAKRTFNKALGTPDDPTSIIGRLWQDADMKGNGYLTIFKLLATELIYAQRVWLLVEGGDTGDVRIRRLPATAVDNWREEDGRLVEVKLIDPVDTRRSIKDEAEWKTTWIIFNLEGWERWEKVEDSKDSTERMIDSGKHVFTDPSGQPALPIFPVELPLARMVGYILSRKANAIFNQESQRDHLLTVAHFPKLNIIGDDSFYAQVVDALKKGSNALQCDPDYPGGGKHGYIAPSAEPAKILSATLERKVDEFWRTGFREYGDSARERTATEVRQDVASGVAAFLQLLKAALDDAENQTLWRIAQVELSDKNAWFGSSVVRSEDFLPPDVDVMLQNLRVRYFGETTPVPVGRTGLIDVARRIAAVDGLEVNDDELAASVDAQALNRAMGLLGTLDVPAEIKAKMTVRSLMDLGYIDPKEEIEVETEDGVIKILLSEKLEAEALKIAQTRQEASLQRDAFFAPEG